MGHVLMKQSLKCSKDTKEEVISSAWGICSRLVHKGLLNELSALHWARHDGWASCVSGAHFQLGQCRSQHEEARWILAKCWWCSLTDCFWAENEWRYQDSNTKIRGRECYESQRWHRLEHREWMFTNLTMLRSSASYMLNLVWGPGFATWQ